MAVLRFLASLFLLIALIALVSDLTRSTTAGAPFAGTAFLKHWAELTPTTLASAKATVAKLTAPWVWDAVVGRVLAFPTYAIFGVLALVCGYAGRRRRRVNIYVN